MVDPLSFGTISSHTPVQARRSTAVRPSVQQSEHAATAAAPVLRRLAADLASQGPPVDYAKIAQLRQAIADGNYQVDPQVIARSIMAFGKAE
jgi:negative regulator of flagellin synthesis FlgM